MLCASLQFLFANAHLQWKYEYAAYVDAPTMMMLLASLPRQYDKVAASLIAAVPNSASTWLWHAPPSRIVVRLLLLIPIWRCTVLIAFASFEKGLCHNWGDGRSWSIDRG
jgi:hypothetical protein